MALEGAAGDVWGAFLDAVIQGRVEVDGRH